MSSDITITPVQKGFETTPSEPNSRREKPSVSQKKLEKRIIRLTGQAITDYDMIRDGDRIMVAMSGGKDSYVLLDVLHKLQLRAPVKFELVAMHFNGHIPGAPTQKLIDYLEQTDIPYHIEDQDIQPIIRRLIPSGEKACSLCARMRRGVLYRVAQELGCNKIALGHQLDDAVSTLLMSMFYGGRMKAMPPVLQSSGTPNIVIRPMIYVRESDCTRYAQLQQFPIFPKGLCGAAENHARKTVKEMMQQWERTDKERIRNIFMSTTRVSPSQLADPELFDFMSIGKSPLAEAPDQQMP